MKLASLNEGRDVALVVVSTDLQRCLKAGMSMQQALDDWDAVIGDLQALSARVNSG